MERLKLIIDKWKILHVAAVLFIINLSFIVIIKNPQKNALINLYDQIRENRKSLNKSYEYLNRLEKRLKKLKFTDESLSKFYSEVLKPKNTGIVEMRKELDSLLRQMNISTVNLTYDNKEVPEYNLFQVSITLPIEGNYASIRRFINKIENSKNFITIESISLTESKATLMLNIKLSAYFKYYETI